MRPCRMGAARMQMSVGGDVGSGHRHNKKLYFQVSVNLLIVRKLSSCSLVRWVPSRDPLTVGKASNMVAAARGSNECGA